MRVILVAFMMSCLAAACDEDSASPTDSGWVQDSAGWDWWRPDLGPADQAGPDGVMPDKGKPDLPRLDAIIMDMASLDTATPDQAMKPDAAPASCAGIKKAVTDEIARIAKCAATSECTFLWGVCPFGCHIPHNKSADLTKYKAALAAFQASSLCQKCTYKCTQPGTLACTAGKCVMSYP